MDGRMERNGESINLVNEILANKKVFGTKNNEYVCTHKKQDNPNTALPSPLQI